MSCPSQPINTAVLRQCREQMGLDVAAVKKKIPAIEKIESGEKKPTFKQMETLADLYQVPDWVFISDALPPEYQYARSSPAFRKFKQAPEFDDSRLRRFIVQIEEIRDLIIELRDDIGEPVQKLSPPPLLRDPRQMAESVREWLQTGAHHSFDDWRRRLEEKDIFIFMTGGRGWAKLDRGIRGFALSETPLPMIVINGSDVYKARSFTLFHELGHLLRNKSVLDAGGDAGGSAEEKWCDLFAGNVLMPEAEFRAKSRECDIDSLRGVRHLSDFFKVSRYACSVRLRQLGIIDQGGYDRLVSAVRPARRQKAAGGGAAARPERKAVSEKQLIEAVSRQSGRKALQAVNQFGVLYARAVWDAYQINEIGLHRMCRLFDLKYAEHALAIRAYL